MSHCGHVFTRLNQVKQRCETISHDDHDIQHHRQSLQAVSESLKQAGRSTWSPHANLKHDKHVASGLSEFTSCSSSILRAWRLPGFSCGHQKGVEGDQSNCYTDSQRLSKGRIVHLSHFLSVLLAWSFVRFLFLWVFLSVALPLVICSFSFFRPSFLPSFHSAALFCPSFSWCSFFLSALSQVSWLALSLAGSLVRSFARVSFVIYICYFFPCANLSSSSSSSSSSSLWFVFVSLRSCAAYFLMLSCFPFVLAGLVRVKTESWNDPGDCTAGCSGLGPPKVSPTACAASPLPFKGLRRFYAKPWSAT